MGLCLQVLVDGLANLGSSRRQRSDSAPCPIQTVPMSRLSALRSDMESPTRDARLPSIGRLPWMDASSGRSDFASRPHTNWMGEVAERRHHAPPREPVWALLRYRPVL